MNFLRNLFACTLLICFFQNALASELPRVSGIVGQEGAWVLAIIESGDGNCRIVYRGETLDKGFVSNINSKGIEVTFPDRTEFLPLQGGTFVATGQSDSTLDPVIPLVTSLTISREDIVAALSRSEQKLSAEKKIPSLNESLGLPTSARISSVNMASAATQQEAGQLIRQQLEKGYIPKIIVSGVPGLSEIYLMPDKPFTPPSLE